jgi:hypothetical protein
MRVFIPASEDATIYKRYPTQNTGLDEILELGKTILSTDEDVMYASGSTRCLLNFDIPSSQQYPTNSVYYLHLRIANANSVNRYQKIEVYPISQSWIEGSGYFYQDVRNAEDGVTWLNRSQYALWNLSGSDYVTTVSASYTISKFPIEDVKINVTNIISPVVSGSNTIPWNGLLVKFPDADETSSVNYGNIKFFSSNTHTIFSPKIEVLYPQQTFITGSLKKITSSNISILPKNLKQSYTLGEIDKIYLVVRDPFPDKRFDAVSRYKTQYYLPSSSYFRIKDQISNVVIYDFDQYSTINCDISGSYILLDTSGFDVDRYYSLELKVQSGSLVFFPEFNYSFKIDSNAQ